jgi:hypothetical protein
MMFKEMLTKTFHLFLRVSEERLLQTLIRNLPSYNKEGPQIMSKNLPSQILLEPQILKKNPAIHLQNGRNMIIPKINRRNSTMVKTLGNR